MTITSPLRPLAPRGLALAGLAASYLLVVLDVAMTNLAGLAIRAGLNLSAAELTLVASGYLVSFAGLLLLGGRLSDVLGGRRMYLIGMAVYLAATVFCALAVSGPMLIAGRIGQGIGASLLVPAALALALAMSATPEQRTRVIGLWGAAAGIGGVLGVALGGVVTEALGWEWVFWAPVPIAALAAVIVVRAVPAVRGRPDRFDLPGAMTITGGISAIAFGVIYAAESGRNRLTALVVVGVGVALLVAFVAIERRTVHPLVPLELFRRGPVMMASIIVLLVGATFGSMFFFLPLFLQQVRGLDAGTAGLTQAPVGLSMIVGSALSPLLAGRLGSSRACSFGLFMLLAGIAWLALNPSAEGASAHLIGAFVLIGAGIGIGQVNAIAIAVRDGAHGESGLLSGLVSVAQQIGAAMGVAALSGIAIGAAGTADEIEFTTAFVSQCVLVALALVLALTLVNRASRRRAYRIR
ncbi:MFS transporter [Dactylosporangium sp. CA-092794]|uniref:MFS transporter n=1 Tax=Dactylosporangium sp. CA-092794 TaxID=3239929 RepID=UPI003D8F958D